MTSSWMKQRDLLVAQTMAFVQGVASQRPIQVDGAEEITPAQPEPLAEQPVAVAVMKAAAPADASMAEAEALMSLIAMSLPSLRSNPVMNAPEPIVAEAQLASLQETTAEVSRSDVSLSEAPLFQAARFKAPIYTPAPKRPSQIALPERDMISQRVASFRASQQRQLREREDHYTTVQAQIRATLGTDPQA